MSLIEDTIVWANQHGIPTPGFTADGQTTVEAAAREIIAAEQALVEQYRTLVMTRAAGLLRQKDLDRLDKAGDSLYAAQTRFRDEITSGRVWQVLNAAGVTSDIPYPSRLPSASSLLGQPTVTGLGDGGVSIFAGVSWGAIVLGVVAVAAAIAITAAALGSAFEARANSQQHTIDLTERLRIFNECARAGTSREECAGMALAVVPPIPPPPGADDPMWMARLKSTAKYAGIALAVLGVGYLGVKFAAKKIDERSPGVRGLASGSFAGARYTVAKPRVKALKGGRARKNSRKRVHGTRGLRGYNMEVQR